MNHKDRATIASGCTALAGVGLAYMYGKYQVKKQKKTETIGVFNNFKTRLEEYLDRKDFNSQEFWRIYEEEKRFVEIVDKFHK